MPATTPIYGLPYMVGTDPPCFGPGAGCDNLVSVFCEFAEIVEGLLDANDLITGRTATAIPMCQIALSDPTASIDIDTDPTPFDTVVFDTDDMADNSAGVLGITPRRNGQYRIDFWALIGGTYTGFGITDFLIDVGAESSQTAPIAITQGLDGAPFGIRGSALYKFDDTTPTPRKLTVGPNFTSPAGMAFLEATLTVYWHSDL